MTARARATLKTSFENGDTPQGSNYEDLIDSAVNLTDSSAQTITSKLTIGNGVETTNVTAQRIYASAATFTGTVSANVLNAPTHQGASLTITGACSVSSVWVDGTATFAGRTNVGAMGIGSAAPSEGLRIAVSGDNNLHLHIATTVVASAGVSGPATPTSVAGFIPVVINGTKRLIAFYNVA
jgi:hypothetical protein